MPILLRVLLLIAALCTAFWILSKIRKSQVSMNDAIFWIVFAFMLSALGLFPQLSFIMSEAIGIISPANFVYLIVIFMLLLKLFALSIKVSQLENKLALVASELAIRTCQAPAPKSDEAPEEAL